MSVVRCTLKEKFAYLSNHKRKGYFRKIAWIRKDDTGIVDPAGEMICVDVPSKPKQSNSKRREESCLVTTAIKLWCLMPVKR